MISKIKQLCLKMMLLKKNVLLGPHVKVNRRTRFEGYNRVFQFSEIIDSSIGFGTYIASHSIIKRTIIGKYCSIGDNVRTCIGLHPSKHFLSTHPSFFSRNSAAGFSFVTEQLFEEHNYTDSGKKYVVEIGNDVWIGNNVSIMDGIKIGDGAIIGLGAVVTKDIEPYSVNVGIPCKKIGSRFTNSEIKELLKIKWWDKSFEEVKKIAGKFSSIQEFIEQNSLTKCE